MKLFSIFLVMFLFVTVIPYILAGNTDVIAKLDAIHISFTEGNQIKEKIVKGWLKDENSGYPDLVKVLLSTIKCSSSGCNVKGPKLPLDVIEGWCKKNRGSNKVIMNHNSKEVKEAYLMTWYERNGYEIRELTIEQILLGQ
ncbi:MAG: hypothetical protein HQK76_19870 [Desulfobacterales bacterium]|nr:hypothetical protein [Desulfobacterales bacterium]